MKSIIKEESKLVIKKGRKMIYEEVKRLEEIELEYEKKQIDEIERLDKIKKENERIKREKEEQEK